MEAEEKKSQDWREVKIGEHALRVLIEYPKGEYRSFGIEEDPLWKDWPLRGMTYPVEYGYIEGYASEDGHDLDILLGTGTRSGYIKVWRMDIPIETKVFLRLTDEELAQVIEAFRPVLTEDHTWESEAEFVRMLEDFRLEK